MNPVYILVLYIHLLGAIAWIGTIFFLRFVLVPTLNTLSPAVRGPFFLELAPRLTRFALRTAEITLAAGLVMFLLMLQTPHGNMWMGSIILGLIGAVGVYALGRAITIPVTMKIVETIRAIGAGTADADAPQYMQALADQQARVLNLQLLIAVIVVLLMTSARWSP